MTETNWSWDDTPQRQPAELPKYGAMRGPGDAPGIPPAPQLPLQNSILSGLPMNLGEIYDAAFRALRDHSRIIFGTALLVATPILALTSWLTSPSAESFQAVFLPAAETVPTFAQIWEILAPRVLGVIVSLVISAILTGCIFAAVQASVKGQKITFTQSWATMRPRLLALCGQALLLGIIVTVFLVLLLTVPTSILFSTANASVIAPVIVLLLPAALLTFLWIVSRLWVWAIPIVSEGLGPIAALRRTWKLGAGRSVFLLGSYVLTSILVIIAGAIINIPVGFMLFSNSSISLFFQTVISAAASAIIVPFMLTTTAIVYYDLRIRTENLGEELAAAEAENR